MPEGHVIHGIADALTGLLQGEVIRATSPQGRFSDGAALIDGCTFTGAIAHGKHLFASFDPGGQTMRILHVHLGLYGLWNFALAAGHPLAPHRNALLTAAGEGKQPLVIEGAQDFVAPLPRGAVRLRLVGKQAVADLNGPSRCEMLATDEVNVLRARLGPDPLLADSDPTAFIRAVRSSRRTTGELLMDQRVISGIGNIYRAELLFRHRIHPTTPGQQVCIRKLRRLWSDAVALLADGKRLGVVVTTDEGQSKEPPGGWTKLAERASDKEADLRWYVYRRNGRPCHRCGTIIVSAPLSNRTVFWCPRCQCLPRC